MCASVDLLSRNLLQKLTRHVHSGIFECNDQKSLNISSLHTDYLNIDSRSGFEKNSERENTLQTKCNFCGGVNHSAETFFKRIIQEKEKACAAGHSDNR